MTTISFGARGVWCTKSGVPELWEIGFKFTKMSEEDAEHLRHYLEKKHSTV